MLSWAFFFLVTFSSAFTCVNKKCVNSEVPMTLSDTTRVIKQLNTAGCVGLHGIKDIAYKEKKKKLASSFCG